MSIQCEEINPENIRVAIFTATPLITNNVYHHCGLGIKITGFLHYTSRILFACE